MAACDWLLALMEENIGEFDSGEKHYLKSLQIFLQDTLSPKDDSAAYYLYIGALNIRRGQIDSVKVQLDKVKTLMQEIQSSDYQIQYWYDCLYEELLISEKDYNGTIEYIHKSKSMEIPDFSYPQVIVYNVPFEHDYLARAYIGLGKTDEAISEYEHLITLNPNGNDRRLIHPKYHYYLAMLYEKQELKDKAIEHYRKFLKLWKNADSIFPEPADARKRLDNLLRH
jgi:tetratricopeptide (TPR) repeat protein